jgi:hypothetical protein
MSLSTQIIRRTPWSRINTQDLIFLRWSVWMSAGLSTRQRVFVVFCSPFAQIPGKYLDQATIASFQILSNLSLISHLTILKVSLNNPLHRLYHTELFQLPREIYWNSVCLTVNRFEYAYWDILVILLPLAGLHDLRRKKIAEEVRLACVTEWLSVSLVTTTRRNLRLQMRKAISGYWGWVGMHWISRRGMRDEPPALGLGRH